MVKAFFLDFYGTIVHEDGEVIKKITQIIMKTGKAGKGIRKHNKEISFKCKCPGIEQVYV